MARTARYDEGELNRSLGARLLVNLEVKIGVVGAVMARESIFLGLSYEAANYHRPIVFIADQRSRDIPVVPSNLSHWHRLPPFAILCTTSMMVERV